MNYHTLVYAEKVSYLRALFAVVRNKLPLYERIYHLLDPEKHPSARFLDHLYAGIAQKKSELLQQKVEQRNEKLLLLQHLEAAQSDVLEDIDTYFEE